MSKYNPYTLLFIFLLIMTLVPVTVLAEPLVLKWTIATQRTDGTPYAAADRGGVKVKYWVNGQPSKTSDAKGATTLTVDVPPGSYNVKAKSYDKTGLVGPYGPTLVKVVVPKPPTPPKPPLIAK